MSKNSKRKCCRNKRNVPAAGLKENNIDFDYDKFTEAIIKAEKKITEEKIRKQKEENDEFQKNWEKALGLKQNDQNEILKEIFQFWNVFIGIITFKKKNIIGENAIYILFKLINSFLLGLYQLILYLITIILTKNYIINPIISKTFSVKNLYLAVLILFSFIFAQLIRIAKLEMENSTDKDAIMSVFNAVIAFTAMILTVITVILTAITLYITINPSSGLIPL